VIRTIIETRFLDFVVDNDRVLCPRNLDYYSIVDCESIAGSDFEEAPRIVDVDWLSIVAGETVNPGLASYERPRLSRRLAALSRSVKVGSIVDEDPVLERRCGLPPLVRVP